MSDKARRPKLSMNQRVEARQHATLLARLQTIELLKMSEGDVASLIEDIEKDPLFSRMVYADELSWKIVKFQPHPRTHLGSSFYELNEETLSSGAPADVGAFLHEKRDVMDLIRGMGHEKFERHFLRADSEGPRAAVAADCGIAEGDVERVREFLLAYSVRSEFFDSSRRERGGAAAGRRVTRLARLSVESDGEVAFEFRSPLLARGRYDIQYDRLQSILRGTGVSAAERRHMKAFVRRLELINWRQNTLFRILDLICHTQRHFLSSRDSLKKTPITQRQMAKKLSVAPSTVNRAIQDRSLVLPWGEEVLVEEMFCSRKGLCVDALGALESEDAEFSKKTDADLQGKLLEKLGFPVPRRTVNTYRRILENPAAPAPPTPPPTSVS